MRLKSKSSNILTDICSNPASYLLVLPALLYTLVFGYLTLPYILIAFQRFNYKTGILNSPWVGLRNFEFFFKSPKALVVTWNTIKLNFLFIIFGVIVALVFSLLLNEIRNKMITRVTQSTYLFPHFLSWVIVSYMVYSLFSYDYGVTNKLLVYLKAEPVNWYSKPEVWPVILIIMRIWKGTGYQVVIFLAAITGIDRELYSASEIDGATRWMQVRYITIPLIMPTVCILTLLYMGKILYGDFAMFYSIIGDNGVLYPTTDVIDTYVFRALRKTGDPSQAMAVGLYQAVIGFILVYGSNILARKYFKEGALF